MIKNKSLSQEGLKLIACMTMLLDHIGAALVPVVGLRLIGRIAFPIYCFLLAEGMARTRDVKKYGIRLAIGAVLAEVPFDLALFGQLTLRHQSVMVTLLLGYLMTLWMRNTQQVAKLVPVIVCGVVAELLATDYGAMGVAVIGLFVLTREHKDRLAMQVMGLGVLCWFIGGAGWYVGSLFIPAQMLGVLAMVPIGMYGGRKVTGNKLIQWGFYLFYPVHLLALWLIRIL